MFRIAVFLMFLGSITLPRLTNLRTPRTGKVPEPVPLDSVLDGIAARIMPAVRISTPMSSRHLRRCVLGGASHPNS